MKNRLAPISALAAAALALVAALTIISIFASKKAATVVEAESARREIKQKSFSELRPQSAQAVGFGVSAPVSSLGPAQPEAAGGEASSRKLGRAEEQAREVPNKLPFRKQISDAPADEDAAAASFSTVETMPAPTLSFNGLSSNDTAAAFGFRVVPPDANGDVGPAHYVQAVNILARVFDKNGSALTPPFKLSSLFSALGTPCARRDDGDPIVLYDALADRWLLSQFCSNFPPFRQMLAVSQTGDPTGAYFVYEFVMPNMKFNDYPKFGVWADAIYMSTDEFLGGDYAGSGTFAFDKRKLYAGDAAAGYVYFDLATPSTIRLGGLLPADLDGLRPPPAGAPGIFVGYAATEYGDARDALRLFEFRADFENPSASTFSERAESPLAVAAFDPTSPNGRADIPQPPPSEPLDAQSDRLMYRAAYRNFGSHDALVVNQTVRASVAGQPYRAGVRLYELRRDSTPDAPFIVREQATVGGGSGVNRWLGSAAQDHQGNLAVGYSASGVERKPSIVYAGKLANEPNGVFRAEQSLIEGTGVQSVFGSRWGDYSQMSVDPTDDCTFWLTNQYYSAESAAENPFGWLTRVGRFKFDECAPAPRAEFAGIVTNETSGEPIRAATVTTSAYFRATDAAGRYERLTVLPGVYAVTAAARGFTPQTIVVTAVDGQSAALNFALRPAALIESSGLRVVAESCAPNRAADPGETVTLNIGLRNEGALAATNLTATLLAAGGVVNPSAAQNYGPLAANAFGQRVSRTFTFTISPSVNCGDNVILTFQLRDGAVNLGTISMSLKTGAARVALRENFDAVSAPVLPAGWTTAVTGGQQNWKTAANRRYSAPNAAFSPAPALVGVNELVSPIFPVTTPRAEISFRNWYDLETTFLRNKLYDGAVLEIKIGDDDWRDIEAAGGAFLAGGYDGRLDDCCQNPLAGRRAWSGRSGVNQTAEFIVSRVRLPSASAGRGVRMRWRVATDLGTFGEGQYIDDLVVTDGSVCGCAPQSRVVSDSVRTWSQR